MRACPYRGIDYIFKNYLGVISAAWVTQTIKDSCLDLGLATDDEDAAPFQELSRHLSTVSLDREKLLEKNAAVEKQVKIALHC